MQPPKPRTDLPERVVAAQPIGPWTGPAQSVAQGLAGQERQTFAALVIEAAGSRSAVEADVFQMPQHRVHGRRPRLRRAADLVADAYGYTGDRTAIRDAIIGRVERNVAMIRQFADGGEPVFQRMLPWAADLERSGHEVAGLPDEFWPGPGR